MVTNAKKHVGKKAKKSPYFTSHKVKIKKKKAPTIGTNRTPPPIPTNTATIPKIKANTNNIGCQAPRARMKWLGSVPPHHRQN